jgi:alpha-(1,6)-fucosyltransferase
VINDLQNPRDCNKAKKLVCYLNKGCGFGCQIHHVTYCLIVALAKNRTLILDTSNWRYLASQTQSKNSWNSIFKPLSATCAHTTSKAAKFPKENQKNQV